MNTEKVYCSEYPIYILLKHEQHLSVAELELLVLFVVRAIAALFNGDVRFLVWIFSEQMIDSGI